MAMRRNGINISIETTIVNKTLKKHARNTGDLLDDILCESELKVPRLRQPTFVKLR
jgi:hypothetical protein